MTQASNTTSRPELGWLIARPIAHRGLHDLAAGVIENSASAAEALFSMTPAARSCRPR